MFILFNVIGLSFIHVLPSIEMIDHDSMVFTGRFQLKYSGAVSDIQKCCNHRSDCDWFHSYHGAIGNSHFSQNWGSIWINRDSIQKSTIEC